MKISDILKVDSIAIALNVEDKDELLENLLKLAAKSGKIINEEDTKNEIIKRENILSTGIGNGVALPHAKTNSIRDSVA
jgi:PTS system fructose-specific IIC component